MTFSPLITGIVPHHNKLNSRNGVRPDRVIQHHHAASSNAGLNRLITPTEKASASYIIMSSGDILGQVPEEFRAWTSGSQEVDGRSITYEVQNSGGQLFGNDSHPDSWRISDEAYDAIIRLTADIANRYDYPPMNTSNYRGHREFAPTACPGGYIWSRMGSIRSEIQARRGGSAALAPSSQDIKPLITPDEQFWADLGMKA